MADIFTNILDMSMKSSLAIVMVLLARLLLRRVPRIYSYVLWFAVLFRLLCPEALVSSVSVMPESFEPDVLLREWGSSAVEDTVRYEQSSREFTEALQRGEVELIHYDGEDSYILVGLDDLTAPDTVRSTWLPVMAWIWLGGIVVLFAVSFCSFLKLRSRLLGAVPHSDGYYLADHIESPFVVGVFFPRIYLPSDLPMDQRVYILEHERHHIRRFDHIVKLAAYGAVCLHWFNPLVWLMFHMLVKDMEMSCDEAVLKKLGQDIRSDYSALLLSLSTGSHRVAWTPLAFGEDDIAGRIKNILSWRRPAAWATVLAVILSCVVSVSAVTDPAPGEQDAMLPDFGETMLHSAEITRKYDPDTADVLTQRQQKWLELALRDLSASDAVSVDGPASNSIFSVRVTSSQGEYILHYGYDGDTPAVTLASGGTEPAFWQIREDELDWLLYHVYICKGAVPLAVTAVPDGLEPYATIHGDGCVTKLFEYYCGICDRNGHAISSRYCDCSGCRPFWAELPEKCKRSFLEFID